MIETIKDLYKKIVQQEGGCEVGEGGATKWKCFLNLTKKVHDLKKNVRERDRQKGKEREKERQTEKQREKERQTEKEREKERQMEKERQSERVTGIATKGGRERNNHESLIVKVGQNFLCRLSCQSFLQLSLNSESFTEQTHFKLKC